ncbi:MAG: zinc metalloprotease HtpX [Gammaproteobacteria bacterium]|nr:zinc metalloprotease HtpX [Gammaproteobacteria bacterium]
MALSDDYHAGVGDWRAQLKRNGRKTGLVIALFILIYVCVGFFIDVLILQSNYPQTTVTLDLWALLTLRAVPYATLTMGAVALISLMVTYAMYDRIMLLGTDYYEITSENSRSLQEKQLYDVVEEMKVAAGLRYMPRVFLLEAPYMNAFASGYSEKSAMVVMTRGLMEKLDRAELQAVMAHELTHIRHHDIKLTLMVAVLSNILLMVVDSLFYSVVFSRNNDRQDNKLVLIVVLLRYLVPLMTVVLGLFLSRTREYMADAGAVELMRDNSPLARALLKITQDHDAHAEQYARAYGQTPHEQVRRASYLFDPADIDPVKSLHNAFSTHPQIEDRLIALGFKPKNK